MTSLKMSSKVVSLAAPAKDPSKSKGQRQMQLLERELKNESFIFAANLEL